MTTQPQEPTDKFLHRMDTLLRSGVQGIFIDTPEMRRAEQLIASMTESAAFTKSVNDVWVWDVVDGFRMIASRDGRDLRAVPAVKNPIEVMETIRTKALLDREEGLAVVLIRNPQLLFTPNEAPGVAQRLQNDIQGEQYNRDGSRPAASGLRASPETFPSVCVPIFIGNRPQIPQAIRQLFVDVDLPLPSIAQVAAEFDYVASTKKANYTPDDCPEIRKHASKLLLGLPLDQVTLAFSSAAVELGADFLTPALFERLEDAKTVMLKATAALTYVPKAKIQALGGVGGFANFKKWAALRKLCYTEHAESLKIDRPKGCVLIGQPGTGKSHMGLATAQIFDLPLLELDVGAVFGGIVGETEANMRAVLRTLEAVGACVLRIDEADKVLAGMDANSASGDSGAGKRVFGQLLSWLSTNNTGAFVIVTMNRTQGIPSEFLRKGRFDEVFYVGFPTPSERVDICRLHLEKRGVRWDQVFGSDLMPQDFIAATGGAGERHTGAEIEAGIVSARMIALTERNNGVPRREELCKVLEETRCIKDDKEATRDIENQAKQFVSVSETEVITRTGRTRRVSN